MGLVGSKPAVPPALIGYGCAGVGIGLAGSAHELFAALALFGFFGGWYEAAMNTQAIVVERAAGRAIMAPLHGAWSVGGLAGSLLGAAMVSAGIDLTTQFSVLGPTAIAIVGVCSRFLIADSPARDRGASAAAARSRTILWPSGAVLALTAVAVTAMLCEGITANWSALYLRTEVHASAGVAAAALTAFSAAMLAVRLGGTALHARITNRILVPTLSGAATVAMATGLVLHRPGPVLVGFAGVGVGVALVVPAAFSTAGSIQHVSPGAAVATISAGGWIAFLLAPPLVGSIAAHVGLSATLWILPLLTGLLTIGSTRWPAP